LGYGGRARNATRKDPGILERPVESVHPVTGAIIERDGVAPGRAFVIKSSSIAERTASMSAMPLQCEEIEYPYSDGKPMAESDLHRDEMVYLIQALDDRYRETPDVYVAGNLFLYYVQGDRKAVVAPDVLLVKGVPKGKRKSFLLWKEGHGPCFVIEVTSESTRGEDLETKRNRYERLGVDEYFLHDPLSEYLNPPLQGYRLQGGRYRRIAPGPDGTLVSMTTGLRLRREGEHLRLIDLGTGKPLLSFQEYRDSSRQLTETVRQQEETIRQKDEALRAAEEELARLRRDLDSRRG
jgi:Uma2 family endonuclease